MVKSQQTKIPSESFNFNFVFLSLKPSRTKPKHIQHFIPLNSFIIYVNKVVVFTPTHSRNLFLNIMMMMTCSRRMKTSVTTNESIIINVVAAKKSYYFSTLQFGVSL